MKKILIIDIETTGFLGQKGQIVEIGIVELDLESGARLNIYDQVVKEKTTTLEQIERAWIIENSDLTVKEIFEAPFLEDLQADIQRLIYSYELGATAYNNKFDFDFLESRGFVFPVKLACPMLLSSPICKLPGRMGGYKWPKVQEAYDYFFGKTDYIELHRGADDAMHEAEIVFELYKRNVFKLKS